MIKNNDILLLNLFVNSSLKDFNTHRLWRCSRNEMSNQSNQKQQKYKKDNKSQ